MVKINCAFFQGSKVTLIFLFDTCGVSLCLDVLATFLGFEKWAIYQNSKNANPTFWGARNFLSTCSIFPKSVFLMQTLRKKEILHILPFCRVQKVEVWTGAKRDYPEELCLSRAVRWKWWNLVFTFFRMRKLTCGSRRCFEGKSAPPQKIVAKTHHPENSVRRTVGKREPLFYGPSIPIPAKGNQEFTWKAGSAVEPAADPAIFGQGVDPDFGVVDPNFGVAFVLRFSNFTRPCYTPYSQVQPRSK